MLLAQGVLRGLSGFFSSAAGEDASTTGYDDDETTTTTNAESVETTGTTLTTASSTSELQVVPDGATTENSSHDKPGSSKPSKTHGRERQSPRIVEAIIRSLPGRVVTVTCLLPGQRRVFS